MTKPKLPALKVADIMTVSAQTVTSSTPLRDAHARMRLAGFRHLPVVDEDLRLVGMLAASDLKAAWNRDVDGTVDQVMNVYTSAIHPDALAREAVSRMLADEVRSLPVVNAQNVVVGIVTTSDFLELAYRALLVQEYLATDASSENLAILK